MLLKHTRLFLDATTAATRQHRADEKEHKEARSGVVRLHPDSCVADSKSAKYILGSARIVESYSFDPRAEASQEY